jgi:hypothetical protein
MKFVMQIITFAVAPYIFPVFSPAKMVVFEGNILWKLKVYNCIHNVFPLHLIRSQFNPVHILISHFFYQFQYPSIHTKVSEVVHLHKIFSTTILYACYMPHPSYPPWFDHPNNIWWRVQIIKLLIIQFSLPSFVGPNILLAPCGFTLEDRQCVTPEHC